MNKQTKTDESSALPHQENDESKKAGERIMARSALYGGARPAAIAWAIDFAQDTRTYSFGEWADRWEEVKRFARDGGLSTEEPALSNLAQVRIALPGRLSSPFTEERPYPGPSEKEMIAMLRGALSGWLASYIENGMARAGAVVLDLVVRKNSRYVSTVGPDISQGFQYHFFHLLAELGPRIHQCRGCKRVFLAGRSDKQWCSGLCQATTWKRENLKSRSSVEKKNKRKGGSKHGKKR